MGKENNKGLIDLINTFYKKYILVIGDTILDINTFTKAIGLSLESPTLKTEFDKEEYSFGGAFNTVRTITGLQGKCVFITNFFKDEIPLPNDLNLQLIERTQTPNIKHRFWVQHGDALYKHLQINHPSRNVEKTDEGLNFAWKDFGAILFCDYRGGLITPILKEKIFEKAREHKIPVFISSQSSSKKSNFQDYIGADYFTMNIKEANEFLGTNHNFTTSYPDYKAWKPLNAKGIYITRAEDGSCFLNLENETCLSCPNITNLFPNLKVDKTNNTIGAGDVFLGSLLLGKENPILGQKIANIVAGLYIKNNKLGDVPCSEDLLKFLKENNT